MNTSEIVTDVKMLVEQSGFSLVECNYSKQKNNHQFHIIIYSEKGIGSDECSSISKLLYPRLEIMLDSRDIRLEVSSPGIDRVIKHSYEYNIYKNKGISLLIDDQNWIGGILLGLHDNKVIIKQKSGKKSVPLDSILKARLDYSQEVA